MLNLSLVVLEGCAALLLEHSRCSDASAGAFDAADDHVLRVTVSKPQHRDLHAEIGARTAHRHSKGP